MVKKLYNREQIVNKLRQIEVMIGAGKPVAQACKEGGITDITYYRVRRGQRARIRLRYTRQFILPVGMTRIKKEGCRVVESGSSKAHT